MKRVDIKVGFKCNNRCVFCVQGDKRYKTPSKDFKEIQNSLKEAFGEGKREVVFTGGEPTIHPCFLDLVKEARKIGFLEAQAQSNGRLFAYKDFCKELVKAGVTQFSPSLHGSNPEIHDKLTRAEGSFDQTVQGIKNLKNLNQYVLTNSVITFDNYKDLPNLAKLLVDLDVDQFQFAFIHIVGQADKNKDWLVPRKTEIMSYVKKGLDTGMDAGKKVFTEAIPFCLMSGYESCVAEQKMPETSIYDAGFKVDNYGDYRRNSGKARRGECNKCKFSNVCEGSWREYVDIFGWDEFKPVLD
ncbi:radical SAM protein [bacterium]|nr:radical SAM protein [bacterium]